MTYRNKCARRRCGDVRKLHEGPCVCRCFDFYEGRVCGADGITYASPCTAKCKNVEIVARGPCRGRCDCGNRSKEVCGADGRTY